MKKQKIIYILLLIIISVLHFTLLLNYFRGKDIDFLISNDKINQFSKILNNSIIDYNKIKNLISYNKAFHIDVSLSKDTAFFKFSEKLFYKTSLENKDFEFVFDNNSHTAATLTLTGFNNYLDSIFLGKLDEKKLNFINNYISSLIKKSNYIFNSNVHFVGDHAFADRLVFLLKYKSAIKNYNLSTNEIDKHIYQLINVVSNDDFFNYRTNHGLMQIKSILIFLNSVAKTDDNEKYFSIISERIRGLIDYYLAEDGSVLEAASGYHIFIYKTLSDIYLLLNKLKKDNDLTKILKNRLDKTKKYFKIISLKNGFRQGLGDSYNGYLVDSLTDNKSYIFNFINNIAGIKSYNDTTGNNFFNLLFVSLYNSPNVHKLPEDLSVYINMNNYPLFINTGPYNYDHSDKFRKYFLSSKSQNGFHFLDIPKTDSSEVNLINDKTLVFQGTNYYKNFKLNRSISFDKNTIIINDSSNNYNKSVSRFLLNKEIEIISYNKKQIKLLLGSMPIEINSNKNISIDSSFVADSFNSKYKVCKLEIFEHPANINIVLPFDIELNNYNKIINKTYSKRNSLYENYLKKYITAHVFYKRIYYLSIIILISILIFSFVFYIVDDKFNLLKFIIISIIVLYLIDIIIDFKIIFNLISTLYFFIKSII